MTAHWIQFCIEPGSSPPRELLVGLREADGSPRTLTIPGITRITEGVDRALAVFAEHGIVLVPDFMLVYPRYAVADELEHSMHELAWLVLKEAKRRGWRFDREIPQTAA